ncbi:MAG: hypothetical protein WBC98_02205 [Candidatus Zixiibacteriota bacterium]
MGIVVLFQSNSTKSVLQSVQEFLGPHWFIRGDTNSDEIINVGDVVYSSEPSIQGRTTAKLLAL